MGQSIDYCVACGERVSPQDIEKGKAIAVQEKIYCARCKSQAPQAPSGNHGKNGSTRKATGSTGQFKSVRPVGAGTTRIPSTGHGSQRIPQVDDPSVPAAPNRMPLFAGVAALVVLVGAAALFFVSNSKENARRQAEETRLADAKAAFEAFVKYGREKPEDPEGQMKMFADATKKCRDTEYASKLRAEADDANARKAALDLRRKRQAVADALQGRISTAQDWEPLLKDIETFRAEMAAAGGDKDFAARATAMLKQVAETRFKRASDEAQKFELENAEKYDLALEKWDAALGLAMGNDAWQKQVQDRMTAIKEKREFAASREFDLVKVNVGNAVKAKDYDGAIKLVEAFKATWKKTALIDEATKLGWEVEAARQKDRVVKPPPTPGDDKAPPGMEAPKDWDVLWDAKTPGSWGTSGVAARWTAKDGELIGLNETTQADAKPPNNGLALYYPKKKYSCYEVEIEFTLTKGEMIFVCALEGTDPQPHGITFKKSVSDQEAALAIEHGKSYTMVARVMKESIVFSGNGIPERGWNLTSVQDGKDHGGGYFGIAIGPQSEIRIKKVRIRNAPPK